MALTMKTFGRLVSVVTKMTDRAIDQGEIDWLQEIAGDIAASDPIIFTEQPKTNLVPLFDFIIQGEKISAIREHRRLTGMGLKESKDEVERLMHLMNASYIP